MGNWGSCIIDEKYRTLTKIKQNNYYPKLVSARRYVIQSGPTDFDNHEEIIYDWCKAKKGENLEDLKITNKEIIRSAYKKLLQKNRNNNPGRAEKFLGVLERDPSWLPHPDKRDNKNITGYLD